MIKFTMDEVAVRVNEAAFIFFQLCCRLVIEDAVIWLTNKAIDI